MPKRFRLTPELLNVASGVSLPALSGVMTSIAANANVYHFQNLAVQAFAIVGIDVRWVSWGVFPAPQSIAFKGFIITAGAPDTGGRECAAHYTNPDYALDGEAVDTAIGTDLLRAYISTGGALSGGTEFLPDELNHTLDGPEPPPPPQPEPEFLAVGSGSTLPGIFEDAMAPGVPALSQIIAPQGGGLLLRTALPIGAGSGYLFVGLRGLWL